MRLYRKDKSFWDGVAPHETARVKGKIETLDGELLHYTKKNLSEHHRVSDSYASLAADYHFKAGKKVGGFGIFFIRLRDFFAPLFSKKVFWTAFRLDNCDVHGLRRVSQIRENLGTRQH